MAGDCGVGMPADAEEVGAHDARGGGAARREYSVTLPPQTGSLHHRRRGPVAYGRRGLKIPQVLFQGDFAGGGEADAFGG